MINNKYLHLNTFYNLFIRLCNKAFTKVNKYVATLIIGVDRLHKYLLEI